MRREFTLTEEQERVLDEASESTFNTVRRIMGRDGSVPTDNPCAQAWDQLGKEMGFDPNTVQFDLKRNRVFTAEVAP